MTDAPVPVIAVVGHPNEGKSSVVSTLTENDRVRISDMPGETQVATPYPVLIDGTEVIRFVDTPGFQNPGRVLEWFQEYTGDPAGIVAAFLDAHRGRDLFRHELELFAPLAEEAGLMMVVDGSRAVHANALKEMEIIRLTGVPRMAVINRHREGGDHTEAWKSAFKRHFNTVRVFNAHKATYTERLNLLEALKHMDQDWEPALGNVVRAFKTQWENRTAQGVNLILESLQRSVTHGESSPVPADAEAEDLEALREKTTDRYHAALVRMEQQLFDELRRLFHHNRFAPELPADSILNEPVTSAVNWKVLGLTRAQVAIGMGRLGAGLGAGADASTAGLSFGVFTAAGTLLGASTALFGGGRIARMKPLKFFRIPVISKRSVGETRLRVGPATEAQFFFVLLDRALLYYRHLVNRAHARRDAAQRDAAQRNAAPRDASGKIGFTASWPASRRDPALRLFRAWARDDEDEKTRNAESAFAGVLRDALADIAEDR